MRKVSNTSKNQYRILSLVLIADVVDQIENEGIFKYFQAQRKEIRAELKSRLS